MLINVVIICLIQSTLAIFHHKPLLSHTKIHVCLTPPNTMLKVQKHILECQNEVKSNIFHEAFSLIHDTAFHHPDDHSHIEYHGGEHDEFANRNFTLTEKEILRFFESHDHPKGHLSASSGHFGSSDVTHENPHDHLHEPLHEHGPLHDPLHPHEHSIQHHPNEPYDSIVHHPKANNYGWQQPYPENVYKKTDAVQTDTKPEETQRLLRAITAKRNPYTYFDIKTGEALKNQERPRRDVDKSDIIFSDHHHSDHHDLHDHHDHHHSTDIHPTTATFKDKRIAGCLMHCLYEKDHAIDPHTGYPTLDGLVNFYSDGVHEHGFFMTTLRAVDFCLKGASHKYHINRHVKPSAGISCDLAFDIFDCVSDRITEYCSKHHYHDEHHILKGHHPSHSGHATDDHYTEEYHDDDTYYY